MSIRRFTLAPDWVFEVLSASTEKLDRGEKLRVYARERVPHVWLIDPLRQTRDDRPPREFRSRPCGNSPRP
jgi:Uma2 family endonuclease